jgi:enamine deaminase RidA (YjgF/YER057c/UK114 family)
MTFVASAAGRRVVADGGPPDPHRSAAILAGDSLFVSGLLPDEPVMRAGDAGAQTRDILSQLDGLLERAAMSRRDVRDLLVYAIDGDASRDAAAACHAAFGAATAVTPVIASLTAPRARVEIVALASRP